MVAIALAIKRDILRVLNACAMDFAFAPVLIIKVLSLTKIALYKLAIYTCNTLHFNIKCKTSYLLVNNAVISNCFLC